MNIKKIIIYSCMGICISALQGCANLIQTYEVEQVNLPSEFLAPSGEEVVNKTKWWEAFNSQDLNAIQEKALYSLFNEDKRTGNFDLQIAYTRLQQSEATLKQSNTAFFPQINYTGEGSRQEGSSNSSGNNYSVRANLSYELDLWGKVLAQSQSSELFYQATYEDLLTTVLSISSNIANDYIDLLATRAELSILRSQVKLNESLVEVQKNRYLYGQATGLDVLQQQEQLSSSKAEKPLLLEDERVLLSSLAILTGELSTSPIDIKETQLPTLPPFPKTGIPADLLENRPDIRAAKYKLLAQNKELGIAKVAYLPSITLSIGSVASAMDFSSIIDTWITNFIGTISGTLFDAGNKSQQAKKQDAITQEAAINYTKTVTLALDEVNTAIKSEQAQKEYLSNLKEQLKYQQSALKEAETSYLFGQDTFLRYITQLQSLQSLERKLVREEANLLKYRINLYKSLGITI